MFVIVDWRRHRRGIVNTRDSSAHPETRGRLNAVIANTFKPFDKAGLEGAVAVALAGEYYGAATFDSLAADTNEASEKRFWELSRNVELVTFHRLGQYFNEAGFSRPEPSVYRELGDRTVQAFVGEPHHDY